MKIKRFIFYYLFYLTFLFSCSSTATYSWSFGFIILLKEKAHIIKPTKNMLAVGKEKEDDKEKERSGTAVGPKTRFAVPAALCFYLLLFPFVFLPSAYFSFSGGRESKRARTKRKVGRRKERKKK